jgi:hypothetical protein
MDGGSAGGRHGGKVACQRRKGIAQEPYVNHLLEVASLVTEATNGTESKCGDCSTKIASEFALEWMIWPSADRKFGWFVEPTYSYSFSRGHEQSIGVTTGLTIAIP